MMLEHLRRMARYNLWANDRLYAACCKLPVAEYLKPRPGVLRLDPWHAHHLLVGDRIWLARIEGLPAPELRLDDQPYATRDALETARAGEDRRMIRLLDDYRDERDRPRSQAATG